MDLVFHTVRALCQDVLMSHFCNCLSEKNCCNIAHFLIIVLWTEFLLKCGQQLSHNLNKLERGFLITALQKKTLWTSELKRKASKRKKRNKRVSCLPIHSNIAVCISQETGGQTVADFSEKWICEMSLPVRKHNWHFFLKKSILYIFPGPLYSFLKLTVE